MHSDNPPQGGLYSIMTAAHELKAPSALVRQLALELRTMAATEVERQLIDQIVLTSERSLRLTSSLTKTARLDDGLFELEPINAQQLCEEVAHELAPLYRAHGRVIDVHARRHTPLVVANRELLRRVLLGFGDNALHYGAADTPVLLTVERQQQRVKVGVRDRGPVLPHRGVPSQAAITGRPTSSGLGLMIAQRFAEAMQSYIGTRRHRDGMTFYINLTASDQLALL